MVTRRDEMQLIEQSLLQFIFQHVINYDYLSEPIAEILDLIYCKQFSQISFMLLVSVFYFQK